MVHDPGEIANGISLLLCRKLDSWPRIVSCNSWLRIDSTYMDTPIGSKEATGGLRKFKLIWVRGPIHPIDAMVMCRSAALPFISVPFVKTLNLLKSTFLLEGVKRR
jgi:hypothetical protein